MDGLRVLMPPMASVINVVFKEVLSDHFGIA